MSLGNGIGLAFDPGCTLDELFSYAYGSFILELTDNQETIGLSLVPPRRPATSPERL